MDHQTFAQLLGNYGEFFGAIAVLGTLLYLAIQIRQNKYAIERDSTRAIITDWQTHFSVLAADEGLCEVIRRAVNDWDALDRNEQMRAHVFFSNVLGHYVNAARTETDELKEFVRAWEDNMVGLLRTPGGAKWYETAQGWFFAEQVKRLNQRLADLDGAPLAWNEAMPWWQIDDPGLTQSA